MSKQEQHAFYTIHRKEQLVNLYLYHRNCIMALHHEHTRLVDEAFPFSDYEHFLTLQNRELIPGEMPLIQRIWKFLHANNRINANFPSEPFEKASPRGIETVFPDPFVPALTRVPRVQSFVPKSQRHLLIAKRRVPTAQALLGADYSSSTNYGTSSHFPSRSTNITTPGLTSASPSATAASLFSSQASNSSIFGLSKGFPKSNTYNALEALAAAFEMPSPTVAAEPARAAPAPVEVPQFASPPSFRPLPSTTSPQAEFTRPADTYAADPRGKRTWSSANPHAQEPVNWEFSDFRGGAHTLASIAPSPYASGSRMNVTEPEHSSGSNGQSVMTPVKKSKKKEMFLSEPPPPTTARTLRSDPRSPEKLVAPLAKNSSVERVLLVDAQAEMYAQAAVSASEAAEKARQRKLEARLKAEERKREKEERKRLKMEAKTAKKAAAAQAHQHATRSSSRIETSSIDGFTTPIATKVSRIPVAPGLDDDPSSDQNHLSFTSTPLSPDFFISSASFTTPTTTTHTQEHEADFASPTTSRLFSPASLLSEAPKPSTNIRICIIGAGTAGLVAGQCFRLHGINNVTILESRSRIGGRIHSTQINDTTIELGAQFTPDHAQNPLKKIITSLGLTTRPYGATTSAGSSSTNLSSPTYNTSASNHASPSSSKDRDSTQMNGSELGSPNSSDSGRTFSKAPFIRSALFKYGAHDYQLTTEESPALSYSSSGTDKPVLVEGGLLKVLQAMARDLNIQTECAVHSVNFNSPLHKDPFYVHYRDPSGEICKSAFDVVLVTIPLGVLKSGDVRFVPALPPSKREAIAKIAVGHQNKVTMLFDTEFWEQKEHGMVHRDDALGILVSSAESTPASPMLQLFWCGDAAKTMNMLDPKDYLDKLIAKIPTSSTTPPKLKGYLWAPWSHDSHCYGAQSYIPAGEYHSLREQMAEPICSGHLGFAGEHTAILRPSTAHGAYESGLREARRIIETMAGLSYGTFAQR